MIGMSSFRDTNVILKIMKDVVRQVGGSCNLSYGRVTKSSPLYVLMSGGMGYDGSQLTINPAIESLSTGDKVILLVDKQSGIKYILNKV